MKSMGSTSQQKLPPQNIDAEQSLFGAVLLENEALSKALEILKPDDFYYESHRQIFQSMIEQFNKNEPSDLITITDTLKKRGSLELAGGASYLADLSEKTPTAANIEYYAKIIKEKAILRNLITSATNIASKALKGEDNVRDILDFSEKTIFSISEDQTKRSFYPLKELITTSFDHLEKLYERKELLTGVPTGFTDLDTLTSGFQPSDLIIVAGRPSMGKTALCLNIAQYAAYEKNLPTAIFSLEMSKEQLSLRMLCTEARVDFQRLRTGHIADKEWGKLAIGTGKLADTKIFIDDTAGLGVLEMRAKARRLKAEHGLGMIIVDYLQLMSGSQGRSDGREQEISAISRSLKALAKELNLPVIALSQLNRQVESRTDKRPQMSDLRESGAIEQDADVILFIYRDEFYHPDSEESKGRAEIIIGKQRNGPTGTVHLTFVKEYTRFENYSSRVD